MPLEAGLLPVFIPFFLCAGTDKELHFHLLKLAHTEDKLAGYNLVAECLTNLGDTKGYLHACRLLYVEEVYEDTLCGFGAQVNGVSIFGNRTKLCGEHQVELADVGPVARATN